MFKAVGKFFRDILTEDKAGTIFCPVRVIAASGAGALIAGAGTQLVMHAQFDPMSFGTGIASIAGAAGLGVGIKAKMGGEG
ncbi:MAG: hypothetical protein ACP5QR_04955 [Rhizomicrobium sp.]